MKRFSKAVENTNNVSSGFKTPNQMRQSIFGKGKTSLKTPTPRFNPSQFRTQHKG